MDETTAPTSGGRARGLRLAVALALGGLALTGCGAPESTPGTSPAPASPFSPYVALGDSYTAVSGVETTIGDPCLRSETSYPHLLATELGIGDVEVVACGGATTGNLASTQYPLGKGRNEPQLDALSSETRLVTLGIGLNDDGYSTLTLVSCFQINGREQSSCAPYLARPQSDLDAMVATIGRNVTSALEQIQEAAPNARVVLVGYPRLLPERGDCPDQVPLGAPALERARTSGTDVNAALKKAAAETDVDFLDMFTASTGHDACSADPWVNGQSAAEGEAFPFHPFPAYHVAVAERLAALLSGS